MGWGDCGVDSQGRPIGYVHSGVCDHDGCDEKIDRGLSHACGQMHGETEHGCEKYFCEKHISNYVQEDDGRLYSVCDQCKQHLLDSGDWVEDEMEGCFVRAKEGE